ncbi:uncharacterized protein DSM5745_09882 [Aspergillus mulundensis]|uniref:Rhodopsin domain-containing protein n=1 Tax=Aspergillus mulundensis TaxID=1810919 RepID=A0A3D8QS12_9EURO|nr:hypothetical protein DSM5745_09882 [Aspergillus mulundensis]RDW64471.1 hypothetical protein DSM5745_09882 [Aspergillus mulundensis]
MDDIPKPSDRIIAAKYTTIAPVFSVVSAVTGKVSVVIFLLRLLSLSVKPWQKWFLYALTFVSIAWNIVGIIAIIGICRPTKKIWLPGTEGTCLSPRFQLVAGVSQSAFNAFVDWALALFPVLIFRNVQLPLLKKVGVIATLGTGIVAGWATGFKCFLLDKLIAHDDITSFADHRLTGRDLAGDHQMVHVSQPCQLFTSVSGNANGKYRIEMYLIIICASVPTMPQCYSAIFHPLQTSYKYNSRSSHHHFGRAEPTHSGIRLQRMENASIFETVVEHGSQESILGRDAGDTDVRKEMSAPGLGGHERTSRPSTAGQGEIGVDHAKWREGRALSTQGLP